MQEQRQPSTTHEPSHDRRVIAHIDADAFYASVHLIEDPQLVGKPVIVAGSGPRSIVTTASYEARAFGVGSAMPAATARRLCAHATFLEPDFDLYRAYSRRAMAIVEQLGAPIEPLSLDEAYLDVSAIERPIAALRELVQRIHDEVGLRYSVGVGPNKLCAKVLSDWRKPAAFNVASREQCAAWFARRSPSIIGGIGPKTTERLRALQIETLEQLREFDLTALAEVFGERRARELHDRAHFRHDGHVQADRPRKSLSEELTFGHDIDDLERLSSVLRDMSVDVCAQLARRDLRGRTIGIKLRLADFSTFTRARTIDERTNDPGIVAAVADDLLRAFSPDDPVRLLGVRVAGFDEPTARVYPVSAYEQLAFDL